jgi:aryl-alcohol dehydrogenase-like predicted oxidoreductase
VNYFDVAPSYGNAEERLGPALAPYRDRVFLACKTGKRAKEEAAQELRQSLERMHTDHFDLYQLHALTSMEEMEQALGPGGALEAFLEARQAGLIRYIGFSAHSVETALAAMDRFDFDSVLFPTNFVLYYQANFGPQVVERAQQKEVGRLALKAMARTHWADGQPRSFSKTWYQPITDREEAALALRFTLSQPITAAIPPGEAELFRLAVDIAERFQPLTEPETDELRRRAGALQPIFRLAA